MWQLERINSFLTGRILPLVLILVGLYIAWKLKFFCIFHPIKYIRDLKRASVGGKTSPFKALSTALAGTLGVGNISGVATAISAGGAGAVFWMWISALCAMSIKYAEVYLAVLYRKKEGVSWKGGAPYYMRDGLKKFFGNKTASAVAIFFAVLLVTNSLLTGNMVQVNAAASVGALSPLAIGIFIALCTLIVVAGGAKRVGDFTVRVIPFLSLVYIVLSLFIILRYHTIVPRVFERIFKEAFTLRSAVGGAAGYGISSAVRYGVTRGIFSNEAGSGTAPTAHAAADTRSPHHQGCFGIFEVFADTIVLCTMTAVVILMADVSGFDGIPLSMESYGFFGGVIAKWAIGISVVIFALATVICQAYYGIEALEFLSGRKVCRYIYIIASFGISVVGALISPSVMWQIADLQIGVMTVVNTLAVFALSDEVTG